MGELIRRRWTSTFQGMSRRDRRGCEYHAFVPDRLVGWNPVLPADLVADMADAESAVRQLNSAATTHVSLEGLARFLFAPSPRVLRSKGSTPALAVCSTRRSCSPGWRRCRPHRRRGAGNVAAMDAAVDLGASRRTITFDDLLASITR